MSFVVINAITVPGENRAELEKRFANRAGQVSSAEGFESFELLRPANEEAGDKYYVYTRWVSKESFEAWMGSQAFQQGHAQSNKEAASGEPPKRPAGTASSVLQYEVIQREEK